MAFYFNANNPMTSIILDTGLPLAGGKIEFFEAGTSNPKEVFLDPELETSAGNTIILDSVGRIGDADGDAADIYMPTQSSYKIKFYDSEDVLIRTIDNYDTGGFDDGATIVSVSVYGAVGDGVTDNTDAFVAANESGNLILVPEGNFYVSDGSTVKEMSLLGNGVVFTDDEALYDGNNGVKFKNIIPDGDFRYWADGNAAKSLSHPQLANTGAFIIRTSGTEDCTAYRIEDSYGGGIRLQRNATTNSTDILHYFIPFSEIEVSGLRGKTLGIQIRAKKSSTYSGGNIGFRAIYSEEPQQPLRLDTAEYASGNQELIDTSFSLPLVYPVLPEDYFFQTITIPETAVNFAIVIDVSFVGTAGADDYIDIKSIEMAEKSKPFTVFKQEIDELTAKAGKNYQSSYPYGLVSPAISEGGVLSAIVVNDSVNHGISIPVQFSREFFYPPTFYFYAANDGQDNELYSTLGNDNVLGFAFGLSTAGAFITNNAVLNPGDVVKCHYGAILRGA